MRLKKYFFVGTLTITLCCTIAALSFGHNSGTTSPNFTVNSFMLEAGLNRVKTMPIDSLPNDSLVYPIEERQGDFVSDPSNNPFDLNDPSLIEQNVEYDPKTGTYIITETIGGEYYKPPTYLTFDEFWKLQQQDIQQNYWEEKAGSQSLLQSQGIVPPMYVGDELFNRLFGSNDIDIRPTGNVEVLLGYQSFKNDNPSLLSSQRKQVQPDFDMDINVGVNGKIGDRMKININFNNRAAFDFDKQMVKLEYVGNEDEIVQEINAGNVNFPLPTTLIPGSQNLWGIQTKLKFGRLTVNSVASQQRSKARSITLQNGSVEQQFEIPADKYDENRHFFLAQYFKNNYEKALKNLPYVNSEVMITRLDVYVNDSRATPNDVNRDVVALADLGESQPFNDNVPTFPVTTPIPDNKSNGLYSSLYTNSNARELDQVLPTLETALGLQDVRDFRKTLARKLNPSEYTYDPQLGFVSLNFQLQDNEVLAVAYEYTTIYGGQYQVGEFAEDVFTVDDQSDPRVLFLKMLKSTTQIPSHPVWNLMMKNVYALGAYQVEEQDFRLDVYYENPGGGDLRYIPEGEGTAGIPLIQVLALDRLNFYDEPYADGVFDFITTSQGFQNSSNLQSNAVKYGTINTKNGRLMFPVLKPFGDHLRQEFCERANLSDTECPDSPTNIIASKYAYDLLYDSTRIIALEHPEFNRFYIKGTYKSSISSEVSLGAFNIPEGSVKVTAGGQILKEGVDYDINYSLGRLSILNEAYVNSGVPINVSYEDNGAFALQQRTYLGTRLDYWINDNFTLGGTAVRLSERPYTQKVNYGDDPIANSMVGLDMNYFTELPWLTKAADKLPLYSTKENSSLTFYAEGAGFLPGHSRTIGKEGMVYIDDFEGSKTQYDLKFPATAWQLASTPKGALDENGNIMFPEAVLSDSTTYGFNRARMAWYQLDNVFTRQTSDLPGYLINQGYVDHCVRRIREQEVFPNTQSLAGQAGLYTFDLAYYPSERGPYNFDTEPTPYSAGINNEGKLNDPESRWAGIMRDCPYKNFEQANVEFIEFWMMDPYLCKDQTDDGYLYFNLGNVSEDILKDARQFYENAMPTQTQGGIIDSTAWGFVPKLRPVTNAFDNNEQGRKSQDVGFDGMNNETERDFHSNYLNKVQDIVTPTAFNDYFSDPSGDNFLHFRDDYYDTLGEGNDDILTRYSRFNGPDGNTPVQSNNTQFTTTGTPFPNSEELNGDNALSDSENYYQYRIKIHPDMDVGESYIADKFETVVSLNNPNDNSTAPVEDNVTWYYFRIPVNEFSDQIGNINFRNIEFIRMFMTDFETPTVCRFARFNIVRNTWRRYNELMAEEGEYIPTDIPPSSFFNLSAVSYEENSDRYPIPYAIPPGIQRTVASAGISTINLLQNEQAVTCQVGDLQDGYARGIYKRVDVDMRQFKNLRMFVHAESLTTFGTCEEIDDGDITAFIRLGDDFTNNYYEYEIPLKVTVPEDPYPGYSIDSEEKKRWIWPEQNEMNVRLQDFTDAKIKRNFDENAPVGKPYVVYLTDTSGIDAVNQIAKITVVGSPDIGNLKQIMLGVRNPKQTSKTITSDDGFEKCAEVWFNELRLSDFDESPGWAAIARADMKIADLANISISGDMHTAGFGTLEQKANERFRDNYYNYDAAANIDLGKFFGKNTGIRLPVYGIMSQSISTPEYDPYDTDVLFKQRQDSVLAIYGADSARLDKQQRQTVTTVKSINVTNARKERTNTTRNPQFYDVANWSATYAYNETEQRDHIIKSNKVEEHNGSLAYSYNARPSYITPFQKIPSKSIYLKWIKEFNFNVVPSNITFRNDWDRRIGMLQLRPYDPGEVLNPTYSKAFTWTRNYGLKYNPARSIQFDFNATNLSVIDEVQNQIVPFEVLWDTIKLTRGGRPRNYNQSANLSYNLPTDKIPLLSWTQIRTRYGSDYYWIGSPKDLADTLGNVIGNGQNLQINGELNFTKLYNSVPVLKEINSKKRSNKKQPKKPKTKEDPKTAEKDDKKKPKTSGGSMDPTLKAVLRPLLLVRRVSLTYNERNETSVPGYIYRPQYLGQNFNQAKGVEPRPYWDFVFGYQPELRRWLEWAATDSMLTVNQYINDQVRQSTNKTVNLKANLEPFRDFKIDLNLNLSHSRNHSEFYKVDTTGNDAFKHLSKIDAGSYSISYFNLPTLFEGFDIDTTFINTDTIITQNSKSFQRFENNRTMISQALGGLNPASEGEYYDPLNDKFLPNYAQGYGPYSQDVLLPAFLAAYTGKDPNDMNRNPFNLLPLPNWRISYNGLSRLKAFKNIFSSFSISHGYNSTLTINNYQNRLDFDQYYYNEGLPNDNAVVDFLTEERIRLAEAGQLDSLTGNYMSYYQIPQIIISEQLSPLIGVNMAFKNDFTANFDYKKARTLTMSFQDYQLSEQNTEEFTIGAGYKWKGLNVGFIKVQGAPLKLENDFAFNADFSLRDSKTTNYLLDQGVARPTQGMKTIRFAPELNYTVSQLLRVTLYYEYSRTIPVLSTSFPNTNTRGGVRINFTLAQ